MRIALCVPNLLTYYVLLRDLAQKLKENGWQVGVFADLEVIFSADDYRRDSFCEFHHVPFPRGANALKHLVASRALRKALSDFCPEIAHVHVSAATFSAALARKHLECPVIATIQGMIFPASSGLKRLCMRLAEGFAYKRMDGVWVLTNDDYECLRRFIPPAKAHLQRSLGFGCRLDVFDAELFSQEYRQEQRRKLNIESDETVFCFIGRRTDFKGFHLVVRAFFQLLDSGVKGKLLLIGEYDPIHPSGLTDGERQRLKRSPEIIDLGWIGDVASALTVADVNVFPSTREGVPINLMESLAMGVPVVTIDSRGCRDVVRNNVDGFVVPEADLNGIANAMRKLASDPRKRRQFSLNAVAARSRFDRETWIREQLDIYKQILQGRASHQSANRQEDPARSHGGERPPETQSVQPDMRAR